VKKKYEFVKGDTINTGYCILRRIRRLSDGLIGGYIQSENNLDHIGDCFVYDNARVYDNAYVYGNASVRGEADVSDNARIHESAEVYGEARVWGSAEVRGNAKVSGTACVSGEASVEVNARVYGSANIKGNATLHGNARVFGAVYVYDNANIGGSAKVYKQARVGGNAVVNGDSVVTNMTLVTCLPNFRSITLSDNNINVGFYFTNNNYKISNWRRELKKTTDYDTKQKKVIASLIKSLIETRRYYETILR